MPKIKKRKLHVPRALLLSFLFIAFICFGIGAGFVVGVMKNLPEFDEFNPAVTTFIHDMDGNVVAELHGSENRVPVTLDQVPKELQDAFIATEDRTFYTNSGISISSFVRAALANFRAGHIVQGGSTITMELVQNTFFTDNPEQTYRRKLQEAILALEMGRKYTKDEILEMYLNQIYFGHGAYGVEAASQTYFGKHVQDLTLGECAMIAGVTNNPGLYSPYRDEKAAKERQKIVLDSMIKDGMITSDQAAAAEKEPFTLAKSEEELQQSSDYPYYVDAVIAEAEQLLKDKGMQPADLYRSGLHIYTSMSVPVQKQMEESYANASNFPASPDDTPVESAMVVLDPHTGEIRGLIGGREHTVERGLNRAVQAKRQPGSSIKPLAVYGPALEQGYSPATVLDDVPTTYYQTGSPPYTPDNYDGRYRGLISMRDAVRWSVNIFAVKMLDLIGVSNGYHFATELGLPLVPQDRVLSLALGGITNGVSPLDMAAAYAAFDNQGVWIQPHSILKITDRNGNTLIEPQYKQRVVMSEQTAYLMTNIMQTVVDSGTGTNARISGRPVAGKTGTTQLPDLPEYANRAGNKDAWFIGYTPELVGAVWMGYDKLDPQHVLYHVYGGGACAPIWKQVMTAALKGQPVKSFPVPDGITRVNVDYKSGLLPSSLTPDQFVTNEVFATQNVPTETSDIWVRAEVCAESGKLPTPACPQVVTKTLFKRPIPYTGTKQPEDIGWQLPTELCDIHGDTGGGVRVQVCTDPRHNGTLYLANIPADGQSGGCPSQYVKTMYLRPEEVPHEYCDIPEHQVSGTATGGDTSPPVVTLTGEVSQHGGGNNEIDLNWEMSSYPGHFFYSVERWTADNPTKYNVAVTTKSSWTDKKVSSGTTYFYQVTAIETTSQEEYRSNNLQITAQAP